MVDRTLSCEACREILSAQSDGEAPASQPAASAHLETCAACREFRDDLDTVRSALRGWSDEQPARNASLLARDVPRPAHVLRRIAAAAAVVVAIAGGFAAGRATAPPADRHAGSTGTAPPESRPLERLRFVVPERNEIHSTISLAAVETGGRGIPERSYP
jgi:hypothetical protein